MTKNDPFKARVRSSGAPGPLTLKEVEELERLTRQLMQDMEHPQRQNVAASGEPTARPWGRRLRYRYQSCGRCHQPLARAQPAVRALGQLFHITCFTCHQCEQQLQGQQFYSLEGAPYCEGCYTQLARGSHVVRGRRGAGFQVWGPLGVLSAGAAGQYAPRCSVCTEPIMPEPGREETVRVVALDKNFHMKCYKCEDCGKPLSIEADDNGCFPLDGHVLCRKCHTARAQT
ncbi:hypothetical protein E2I00_007407 [Balaenoptera physalus]|uniref:Zyxin n=1 Tax=Balaenoptera physalus TaxID=9770 RepID=A0A6A1Q6S9_BALPH|nr:hypothetical protein E2I00_007407 [Balaenoptera physalus]